MKISATLYNAQQGHTTMLAMWVQAKAWLIAGHRLVIEIRTETRSLAQNRLMWSVLADLSKQVQWPVDGRLQHLDAEDWKDVLSAGLKRHQRVAQGIEGGFVILGQHTSKLTVSEMADLVTIAHALGDEHGVVWSRTSLGRDVPDQVFA